MPGPFPVSGQSKSHMFGVVPSGKKGPTPGTVEHDTHSVATRTFKENKDGVTTTYEQREYQQLDAQDNKVHKTVVVARTKNLSVGEVIGIILSYLLLTPIVGVLIHNAILSSKQLDVADVETDGALPDVADVETDGAQPYEIMVEVDEDGDPIDTNLYTMLANADISLTKNTSAQVYVVKPPSSNSDYKRADDADELDALTDNTWDMSRVKGYISRDLQSRGTITILPASASSIESKGSDSVNTSASDVEKLPEYVQRFLASPTFGGVHGPMKALASDTGLVNVVLELKGKTVRGSVPSTSSNPVITITPNKTGYTVEQTITSEVKVAGKVCMTEHYATSIEISQVPGKEGQYQIDSLVQEINVPTAE